MIWTRRLKSIVIVRDQQLEHMAFHVFRYVYKHKLNKVQAYKQKKRGQTTLSGKQKEGFAQGIIKLAKCRFGSNRSLNPPTTEDFGIRGEK